MAVRMLMAVWMLPAACAAESLLVRALAMPALSMHPAFNRSSMKLLVLDVVVVTVMLAVVEWVSDPEAPVTVSAKLVGTIKEGRLTLSTEEAGFPPEGVTGLGDKEAVTAAGCPEPLRFTAELNPLTGFTMTVVEAVAPAAMVNGETALKLKSPPVVGAAAKRLAKMPKKLPSLPPSKAVRKFPVPSIFADGRK